MQVQKHQLTQPGIKVVWTGIPDSLDVELRIKRLWRTKYFLGIANSDFSCLRRLGDPSLKTPARSKQPA